MQTPLKALAALGFMSALALPVASQTIDSFDGAYNSQTTYFSAGPPMEMVLEKTVAAAVPGGSRRLQLVADPALAGWSSAALSGEGDLYAFAGGGQRLNFNFAYGTQAAMHLDLSGAAALRLDVYVGTPMNLVIYATTQSKPGGNPNGSALTIDLPSLFKQSFDIPLSAFATNSATGLPVDWADVDGLAFFVSGSGPVPASGDAFWIRELSALPVPEPGSAWLLASGLALLIGRRKLVASRP